MSQDVPLPISFDDKKQDQYRGTTAVVNRALEQNALNLKTDHMSGKNASIQAQTQAFGGKANEIVTLVMDEAGVQSKLQKGGTENIYALRVTQDAPQTQVFNDISSFAAPKNMNESQVITKLNGILSSYNDEIDFESDFKDNEIKNGVVFVNNYYSVFFTIWTCKDADGSTRFEFRRQSGDALASAKFLGDIKSSFFGGGQDADEKEADSLINLELNVSDMAELKVNEADKEMMMIHEALIDDEFVGDSLEENAENYLFQKLIENKAINNDKNKLDHKILCKTLMNKSLLLHRDISVTRASLLILSKFVNIYNGLFMNNLTELMDLLNKCLKQNRCKIVKRYVVNLLCEIAVSMKKDKWDLSNDLKRSLTKEIKDFEKQNESNKKCPDAVFDNIYKKL
jgi:hypothetical protein